MHPEAILERIIYPVVDEFRQTLSKPDEFERSASTVLFGTGSAIDSVGVVSFIVAVEERLEAETGKPIRLVSEEAMSRKKSPFKSLQTLADYIGEFLSEKS